MAVSFREHLREREQNPLHAASNGYFTVPATRQLYPTMAKEEPIELEGTVTEVLPDATFRVQVANGHDVHATIAGKMRRFRIRVLAGDRVTLEVSPYDLTRGRITFRHKN